MLSALLLSVFACGGNEPASKPASKPSAATATPAPEAPMATVQEVPPTGPLPTLFLAQAQFIKDAAGKPKPGPAAMVLWQKGPDGWKSYKVEDADSNVFHKILSYKGGLLSIGAEKAMLKEWKVADGKWTQETWWNPKWEGKFNRLRDVEIGDVNGDGQDDVVVATHDFGVVAVGSWVGDKLVFTELDKAADTFVHEVEIGDIDGDGKNEFFVTPSGRNQSSGKSQPGQVRMYRWDGTTYKATLVDDLGGSHAKEILAVNLDGSKKAELYSVMEAETELGPDGKARVVKPVEIRHYILGKDGSFTHEVVATIDDKQCRFLVPGDFDGDGKTDLMAAAMKTGIWFISRDASGKWVSRNIETSSSGFEHTAYATDLDGDGKLELYVAADEQRELRSYLWNAATSSFDRTTIGPIAKDTITWNMTAAQF
jgi:FG-GAP-like repeat